MHTFASVGSLVLNCEHQVTRRENLNVMPLTVFGPISCLTAVSLGVWASWHRSANAVFVVFMILDQVYNHTEFGV